CPDGSLQSRSYNIERASERPILRGAVATHNEDVNMSFVLALDQGTTSSRAIVFDHAGAIHTVAQQEFKQHFPRPAWAEHDPMDIWATQPAVADEALARARITATDLAGIGITNQRETTVLWERNTGRPVANAIVWQDRRTAGMCDALREAGHAATIQRKTGL